MKYIATSAALVERDAEADDDRRRLGRCRYDTPTVATVSTSSAPNTNEVTPDLCRDVVCHVRSHLAPSHLHVDPPIRADTTPGTGRSTPRPRSASRCRRLRSGSRTARARSRHIRVPGPHRYPLTTIPTMTCSACRPVIVKYRPRKLFVARVEVVRELVAVLDRLDDEEDRAAEQRQAHEQPVARQAARVDVGIAGANRGRMRRQRRPRHHHRHRRGDQDHRVERRERHAQDRRTAPATSARRSAAARRTRTASRTASPPTRGTARSRASGWSARVRPDLCGVGNLHLSRTFCGRKPAAAPGTL